MVRLPFLGAYAARLAVASLPLALLAPGCDAPSSSSALDSLPLHGELDAELEAAFAREAVQSVIVNFREPETRDKSRGGKSAAIRRMQDELMSLNGLTLELSHRYESVPAMAARLTRADALRLLQQPNVESIFLDAPGKGQLKEAVAASGADVVHSVYGLTGKGVRVAVLDSGAATTHPDLMDSIVAQRCFTRNACPPSRTATSASAEDDHGHGTNVSGIITSNGTIAARGFAPAAELVAVKVNDQNDAGMESDWVAGLDYVYQNLATLRVRVVNLSLGTTAMHSTTSECDSRHPAMRRAIENLVEAGVVVFVASGNSGSTTALPAPACLSAPITVGAVYDSRIGHAPPGAATYYERWGGMFARCGDDATDVDTIACFTNSTAQLDLLAPGAPVTSTAPRNRTDTYFGTSQASPAAAGVAALMLECNPGLSPDDIRRALVETGAKITDKRTGLSFPSLRAKEAVLAACPALGSDGGASDPGDAGEPLAPDASAGVDSGSGATDAGRGGTSGGSAGTRDASSSARPDASRGRSPTKSDDGLEQDQDPATADDDADDVSIGDDEERSGGAGQGRGEGGCGVAMRDERGNESAPSLLGFGSALAALLLRRRRRSA